MKKLFITLAVTLCFLTTLSAQAPIQYSVADHDDISVQQSPLIPGSAWGGSTGAGTKWCFPQSPYKGICIWRLSDASVFPNGASVQTPDNQSDNSVQTPDNQEDNIVSAPVGNIRYIVARAQASGASYIIKFDSTQNTATKVGSILGGDLMFDETNPGIIYARENSTQIMKYTSSDGWNTYQSQLIYDFANCLPPGFQVKWNQSTWATATPEFTTVGTYRSWGSAFSEGVQDTAYWALAYRDGVGGGCASIDTLDSVAYGWNGQPSALSTMATATHFPNSPYTTRPSLET